MPVITFANYLYSFTQGPYYRFLGRHTRRFCGRAVEKAGGEPAKKLLMVAAAGADDFLAPLLGVDRRDKKVAPAKSPKAIEVTAAMKVYLSALLVTLGEYKAQIMEKTGLEERLLLQKWCLVFEYQPEDMRRFDQELVPAYQHGGIDGLAATACAIITPPPGRPGPAPDAMKQALVTDIAAIHRILEM